LSKGAEIHNKAAGEIVELVAQRLGAGRGVHAETAIASTARLAGSLLLRSFDLALNELGEGAVMLSAQANDKGPRVIGLMSAYLEEEGVSLDSTLFGGQPAHRGDAPTLDISSRCLC